MGEAGDEAEAEAPHEPETDQSAVTPEGYSTETSEKSTAVAEELKEKPVEPQVEKQPEKQQAELVVEKKSPKGKAAQSPDDPPVPLPDGWERRWERKKKRWFYIGKSCDNRIWQTGFPHHLFQITTRARLIGRLRWSRRSKRKT